MPATGHTAVDIRGRGAQEIEQWETSAWRRGVFCYHHLKLLMQKDNKNQAILGLWILYSILYFCLCPNQAPPTYSHVHSNPTRCLYHGNYILAFVCLSVQ